MGGPPLTLSPAGEGPGGGLADGTSEASAERR